jgi:hypothetical protein
MWLSLVADLDSYFWFVVLRFVHLIVLLTEFHQSNNKPIRYIYRFAPLDALC